MRLDAPLWLAALVALLPLGVYALVRRERRRRADRARYGDASLVARASAMPPRGRRIAADGLVVAALALVVAALARPQWGESRAAVERSSRDVLFVLDLSRSMNAADAYPSRLAQAKAAARAIADSLPHDRVGLEVFGGNAFLQLPLTADHGIFARFIDAVSTEDVPDPATDIEGALDLAATTFARDGGAGSHTVVLLTDGEETQGSMRDGAQVLAKAHIHLYAVGVGSTAGATVPETPTDSRPHHDWRGQTVVSRLDESELGATAALADGRYARWTGPAGAAPVIAAIRQLGAARTMSRERAAFTDRFEWPVAVALLALVLESLLRAPRLRASSRTAIRRAAAARAAALVLVAAGLSAALGAQPRLDARRAARAMSLYEAGRYRDALDELRALARDARRSNDPDAAALLSYDIGNTLYRLAQFDQAVTNYRLALGGPPDVRRRALFNLGDAYMHVADEEPDKRPMLHAAINAYTEALIMAPRDVDAKWNLELALRRLADEETRFGGGPHRKADWGGGNLTKSGYAGAPRTGAGASQGSGFGNPEGGQSAPQISESQARQMLDALQRAMVTGQVGGGSRGAKATSTRADW
ncbi:MAG TPA: VWA domain-containing protein [Gemmatimonadaceae bacterium]|nr:VWA domain-containing protein [Gemmatimonadaceae bacterium]